MCVPTEDTHQMSGKRGPSLPSVRLIAHLMLADYAVVSEGKLYLSGGGWTRALSSAVVMAIGGVIIKPWQQLDTSTELSLRLVRGDGATVLIETPAGPRPFEATAVIAAEKPAKLPRGADASAPFGFSFPRPQLASGSYAFIVSSDLDGEIARLPFEVDD